MAHPLGYVVRFFSAPFEGYPHLYLVFVMFACPLGLSAVQLWVVDSFLRWREVKHGVDESDAYYSPPPSNCNNGNQDRVRISDAESTSLMVTSVSNPVAKSCDIVPAPMIDRKEG